MKRRLQFCDNCIHGAIDFSSGDLTCHRKQPVRFEAPPRRVYYKGNLHHWGWRPIAKVCRFYQTLFQNGPVIQGLPKPKLPYKHRGRGNADATYRPSHEPPRPALEPPHGAFADPLPVKDLPGLDALHEQYAADIDAGRSLSERMFGPERGRA